MAKTRHTESAAARQARVKRGYATAQSIRAIQGPVVREGQAPISGETFLMRRIDLARLIGTGVWPEPITTAVRKLMVDGGGQWISDAEKIERNLKASAAIARAIVIVPPQPLIDGDITVDQITADQCKPLFVESDPDEDQLILVAPGDPEPPADDKVVRLHPWDLSWIATNALAWVPGAMSSFRQRPEGVVAGVGEAEGDGATDQ